MTNQEAFDRATIIHDTLTTGKDLTIKFNLKNVEWIIKAAEALEKQIPQKSKYGCCHNCGTSHLFITDNLANPLGHPTVFCWNCGQAIDWSKEE